jgi:excisionase family DNA binding protein
MKTDEVLTIDEAAKKYKTTIRTISKRIKEGELPASKPFGKILIKLEDLEKYFRKTSAA